MIWWGWGEGCER